VNKCLFGSTTFLQQNKITISYIKYFVTTRQGYLLKNIVWDVTPFGSCKTGVIIRATGRHILEDGILHSHSRENLKS
jgi:hypothetical protein